MVAENIETGKWPEGMRLPSEQELAERFDVTRLTVRKAIEPLKRDGRLAGRRGQGTFVMAGSSRVSSLLYVGPTEAHFYQNLFHAVAGEGQDEGRTVIPFRTDAAGAPDPESRGRLAAQLRAVKWAVVCNESYGMVEEALRGSDVHLMITGWDVVTVCRPAYFVLADMGRAVELAVARLVGWGHRRIGLVTPGGARGPETYKPYFPSFHAAIARHGLERTASCLFLPQGEGEIHDAIRTALRAADRPTALVCDADFRARAVYAVAREEGLRIPEDLSLIGIGDTPWTQAFIPELTSVNLGEDAMAHLIVMLSKDGPPIVNTVCYVVPHLAERRSCRAVDPASAAASQRKDV